MNSKETTNLVPRQEEPVQYYKPDVDIFEGEQELVLIADLPGSASDKIHVDFNQGKLSIRAEVNTRQNDGQQYMLKEYGVAEFFRSFEVSEAIDLDKVLAEYVDGVLTLRLPKQKATQARKIEIKQ